MDGPAVEIEYLRKRYGGFEALAGVSLSVPRGSVFGLLGPNGAGKSTMIKSLLTIIRPTECRGRMLGKPIGDRATLGKSRLFAGARALCGVSDGPRGDCLLGRDDRGAGQETRGRVDRLLETVGMKAWGEKKLGTYSKGMRQRIGLAQALVNEPEIVFLDEPTDGVDPEGRIDIRKMIEGMKAEGRTVFVNSHLLGEVEQVADQVAILSHGKVIRSGSVEELTGTGQHFELRTQGPVPPPTAGAAGRRGRAGGGRPGARARRTRRRRSSR